MYKFVSNITVFKFSSAYKKPKPHALTHMHANIKRSHIIHIQTQPATQTSLKLSTASVCIT